MGASKSRLIENLRPTNSLHRPTTRIPDARPAARHNAVSGLLTLTSNASGQWRSIARATSLTTGTLRKARAIPPGPTLSPTGWRMP